MAKQETHYEWIMSRSAADEKLAQIILSYEDYFDEMNFQPGSIIDSFITYKILGSNGSWQTTYDDFYMMSLDGNYRFYVANLEDEIAGQTNGIDRTIEISPEYLDDKAVILHEMIHAHENLINNEWLFYHDIILLCLYNDLKGKITDLDAKILEHTHVIRGDSISMEGGSHDILFLLKGLDLDLRCGFELGTVCGYGRKELFNGHAEEGTPK